MKIALRCLQPDPRFPHLEAETEVTIDFTVAPPIVSLPLTFPLIEDFLAALKAGVLAEVMAGRPTPAEVADRLGHRVEALRAALADRGRMQILA